MTVDFEKLGVFYLGREFDPDRGVNPDRPLLYDARDLTTHAVCVGMTGSGKTGLCLSLLEEAAIDAVPALAIDPKGDLGNLLLAFPELRPEDFRPWIDPAEAAREGRDPDAQARETARTWREGLAAWGQTPERIARFRDAADIAIYTPGSQAGLPLSILGSLAAPTGPMDPDDLEDRVSAITSGLLTLLGIPADPLKSREHILVASLIGRAWREGRSLDLAALIGQVQSPPFTTLGALDLESFYPAPARSELALVLNHLLASPAFASWREGEPIDIQRLLWTPEGKPRIAVLSIAHLSDPERMFFVTLLLQELITWMRAQPGTGSLRALLYMDEVFGFFPPVADPPAKKPMLTLLKQARAYGVGVVLTTQNPVDLDYKGLANAGTWFLGRLQTERDKARVLEGLEGAAAATGLGFDRAGMETLLAGLKNRVFLLHNVHEDAPTLFHTRWCLSYLRGPLTREEIGRLMAGRKAETAARAKAAPVGDPRGGAGGIPLPAGPAGSETSGSKGVVGSTGGGGEKPMPPAGVSEAFLQTGGPAESGNVVGYRPGIAGTVSLHFVLAKHSVDIWREEMFVTVLPETDVDDPWQDSGLLPEGATLAASPRPGKRFATLPPAARNAKRYPGWGKALAVHAYQTRPLVLFECPPLKLVSKPGESEGDFRARLTLAARESRDRTLDKLAAASRPRMAALEERIRRAEARVERERSQYETEKMQTAVSLGATVLGALLGKRAMGVGTVGRAATTARGVGRAARQKGDVSQALENVSALREELAALAAQLQAETTKIIAGTDPGSFPLQEIRIAPRKSDLGTPTISLVWIPA